MVRTLGHSGSRVKGGNNSSPPASITWVNRGRKHASDLVNRPNEKEKRGRENTSLNKGELSGV